MRTPGDESGGLAYPSRLSSPHIAQQITHWFRAAIADGTLAEGSRVLSSRELALRMGVSRNTVVAALEQLVAEGHLASRVGSGTFVAPRRGRPVASPDASPITLPASAQRFADLTNTIAETPDFDGPFRLGLPSFTTFPIGTWERLSRRWSSDRASFTYGNVAGSLALREALAAHLRQFRGVIARAKDIIIVDGAQSAISLIAQVMLEAGERVVFEDPCYSLACSAFSMRGALIERVRIDDDGLDAATLPSARLAYVTPSHQYPLGGTMSAQRRASLFAWAAENDAYIVEDDYDGEFHFNTTPPPAMQGDDPQRILYVGTFSKVLAPGLRIGYLVCPPHLVRAFTMARALTALGAPGLTQLILADFIAEGHLARHVRRLTPEYRRRAMMLADLLRPHHETLAVGPLTGGMHLAVRGIVPFDDVAVARSARDRGVLLHPLSRECHDRPDLWGFVLGFGVGPPETLEHAVAEMMAAIREALEFDASTCR